MAVSKPNTNRYEKVENNDEIRKNSPKVSFSRIAAMIKFWAKVVPKLERDTREKAYLLND
jgi:hypothetical protein